MASNERDWSGQRIGRYRILEKLGEGGMAVVYRAFDSVLEREVAFKVILPGQEQSPTFLKRFEREAKALARLSHPNIVDVIDYGTHNGAPYLVMVYAPGGTLRDWMEQPMHWAKAAQILAPIARALAYAHQENIIHRDVKPSNILIGKSGDPLLSDFGIAKLVAEGVSGELTTSGIGIGTVEYMAPEQVQGMPADGRSDVYSLGVVFYELVTGHRPYEANAPVSVIWKLATEELISPRTLVPDLPEEVETVILKALGREARQRYADMHTFASALEDLAALGRQSGMREPLFPMLEAPGVPAKEKAKTSPSLLQRATASLVPLARGRTFFVGISFLLLMGLAIVAIGQALFRTHSPSAPSTIPTASATPRFTASPVPTRTVVTPRATFTPSERTPSPEVNLTALSTPAVYTDYRLLGVSFPSGKMMVSIEVPGIDGEFRAKANGVDYECFMLHDFPDRLYCIGPVFLSGTEITLRVYPLEGYQAVLEVNFSVPAMTTSNSDQAQCYNWCAFADTPQDATDKVDCGYASYDLALAAAHSACQAFGATCTPSAYCGTQ